MLRKSFIKFCLVLFIIPLAFSCSSETGGAQGEVDPSELALKKEFDAKFLAWQNHCEQIAISVRSDTSSRTNTEEYRALIAMGTPALPLLMEKLEAGEFFLNDAVKKITGINIVPRGPGHPKKWGPGAPPFSAQEVSKLWIAWWKEHKDDPEWKTASAK